jgi:hypothetical protein
VAGDFVSNMRKKSSDFMTLAMGAKGAGINRFLLGNADPVEVVPGIPHADLKVAAIPVLAYQVVDQVIPFSQDPRVPKIGQRTHGRNIDEVAAGRKSP